jgi:hypothetical protein
MAASGRFFSSSPLFSANEIRRESHSLLTASVSDPNSIASGLDALRVELPDVSSAFPLNADEARVVAARAIPQKS